MCMFLGTPRIVCTFRVRFRDHENAAKSERSLIQGRGSWGHSLGPVTGERGMPEVTCVLDDRERACSGLCIQFPILPQLGDL